jgi:energy-coupling factor transport system ATP-binding protein
MQFSLTDISYSYPLSGGGTRPALNGVSLTIPSGSCCGLIGPEGSGKTTLLLVLDMLLTPQKGTIAIGGEVVRGGDNHATRLRKRIGMEFQFPEQQFVAATVLEEMLLGTDPGNAIARVSAENALLAVGLDPGRFLMRSPFRLSMGEARRVALASLMLRDPEVLLLDEPTAGLDGQGREDFLRALTALRRAEKTIVIVSHDLDLLAEIATDIVLLQDGRVIGTGGLYETICDSALLDRAGYDVPEIIGVLEMLGRQGKVPPKRFFRAEELALFLRSGSSEHEESD